MTLTGKLVCAIVVALFLGGLMLTVQRNAWHRYNDPRLDLC